MNQKLQSLPAKPSPTDDDPYFYGWRYVNRTLPDGTVEVDQIPLSEEDILFPEEDDHIVQDPKHTRDFVYFHSALDTLFANRPEVVVLGDNRIDWCVAGIRPLGPDIVILFDVPEWLRRANYRVAEEHGRTVLVIEVISPSTRDNDLEKKLSLYQRIGIPQYVIVDRGPEGTDPVCITGLRWSPDQWSPMETDDQGRMKLEHVQLLIGIEDDRPWLYDAATGKRIPERVELVQELEEFQSKARQEAESRHRAEVRADAEAETRAALEKRLCELEEQLREQQPPPRPNGAA